jgi:hypothetical protein
VTKKRDSNREAFWRRVLRRRAKSGLKTGEFCAREGLKTTAYYYWQREIRRRDGEPQDTDGEGPTGFVPVQVVDDRGMAAPVEIIASNGFVIRVGEQATPEHLRRVLQAVGELD